jgi:hypothetical protein
MNIAVLAGVDVNQSLLDGVRLCGNGKKMIGKNMGAVMIPLLNLLADHFLAIQSIARVRFDAEGSDLATP